MKKTLLFLVLALLGSTTISLAGEAVYYPSSGRVSIPQLTVDGDPSGTVYNVDLQQRADTLTFEVAGISLANSAPVKFSKEWLAGKTLYDVWLGNGFVNGHEVDDVNGVAQMQFNHDGTTTFTGLLNDLPGPYNVPYHVDEEGRLFFGDDTDSWFSIVCGSTDRYIKTHHYDQNDYEQQDGIFDNVDLFYFDKNDALSAAEFLTGDLPKCPTAP